MFDYKEKFSVAGKCCIVTGGAQGLSRGMAEALLENGAGVVLMDVQKEKLEKVAAEYTEMGYKAYAVTGNLADRDDLNRMFDEAMEILGGRLDVLIPAAGIQRRHLPEEFPMEEWDLVRKINLDHVFLMIQRALQVMLKQETGGKIITIGSMVTWFGGTTVPAYTASKGAVSQLTKSIAVDCAGRGIHINALAPGYMDTEMVKEFFYAISYSAGMNLHMKVLTPGNNHHMIEAMFKAFGKALDMATGLDERVTGVLSTKGSLG